MPPQVPIQPVAQPQPGTLDFTNNQASQPQPAPAQPVAPQPDPAITQLQNDIAEIKNALTPAQPVAPAEPVPQGAQGTQPKYFNQKYDDWGVLEQDTTKLVNDVVEARLTEVQSQSEQANQAAQQQEAQNQQYIDSTLGQLRQAGYLPTVNNQFDSNDSGKQAENELLGYAISLGSTDLVSAAQELKFRHDAGFKYDYGSKQFVQVNQPNTNDPNAQMFGNLPVSPDQPAPQVFPQSVQPSPQGPVGPQNPYAQQQYPAGFNAPVSSGNSYMGVQNGVPSLKAIRGSSYDSLVENFNRSQ